TGAGEHGFHVFLRLGALVALLPAFGEQSIPMRVKLAIALAFALIVAPAVPPVEFAPGLAGLAWSVLTETLSGFLLGIGLRFFVFALQTAGAMAAQSMSLSQLFGQAGVDPMPAMGHVLTLAGLTLAVTAGLHVRVAELAIRSYDFLPMARLPLSDDVSQWGVTQAAGVFALAFRLAAPFLIASTLYNLAMGVINRAMPQLMVAFVGAPLITAGGLALLFIVASPLLSLWLEAFHAFIENPIGAGR
ncbi:MAG: flagellar biosynthetic protein FliR, partial [Rhodobacteraceae bacterium]|nr:flagellar biosynthetic protein FliR [Paracoccaceae bacterium]